ncbi:phage protein GemA/Gp16 family protein [Campylobacter showae]|uniref:phage protein GemA/Gp16 family protein n=1 Tax=Campylobacter showae TaxID=204 RepID=UPI0026ED18BA|nr:phage protein GemA/Gp16 family protein [Campylobacter showae]
MTKNQDVYRKQLLTIIHTDPLYKEIKRNEAWQDWLDLRFGVKSSKELSINELNTAVNILRGKCEDRLNFTPDYAGRNLTKPDKITQKQIKKIEILINELGWDEPARLRFFYRQTGCLVPKLYALDKKRANKIITGLEAVIKTQRAKARG